MRVTRRGTTDISFVIAPLHPYTFSSSKTRVQARQQARTADKKVDDVVADDIDVCDYDDELTAREELAVEQDVPYTYTTTRLFRFRGKLRARHVHLTFNRDKILALAKERFLLQYPEDADEFVIADTGISDVPKGFTEHEWRHEDETSPAGRYRAICSNILREIELGTLPGFLNEGVENGNVENGNVFVTGELHVRL